MPKRLKKVLFKTRDENGNYVTIDMSTGLRKTNVQTKQSTTINKPQRKQSVKRTLKPGEQVFTDWRTGKKTVFTPRRAEVKSDNRSEYQKQEDQKTADILHQKHEQEKTTQEGLKNLEAIGKVISPSTYVGPLANRVAASVQGDKQDRRSIGEQILSGEGTGDTAGNLLLDFASPYAFSKLPKAANIINKFMLPVTERIIGKTPFRGTYLSNFLNKAPSINDYRNFYRTNFVDQNLYFKGPSEFKSMIGRRGYDSQPMSVGKNGFIPKDDYGSFFVYNKDGQIINSDKTRGDMFSTIYNKINDDGSLRKVGITKNFDRNNVQWHGIERQIQPQEEFYIHGESNKQPVKIDSDFNLQPKPSIIEGVQPKVWSQSNTPYGKNYSRYIISPSSDYNGELSSGIEGFSQKNFRVTDSLPLKNATMFEYEPLFGSFQNNRFISPNGNKPFVFDIDQPNSQYIDKDHLNIGSYINEGGESFVYNTAGDPNTVTKIKVPISDSIEDYEGLQRAVNTEYQQNKLPFFFNQDYLGYTDKNSIPSKAGKAFGDEQFRIVTKQPKVTPFSKVADPWFVFTENDGRQGVLRFFNKNKIYDYLKSYGVERTPEPGVYKYNGITFGDVAPKNAGIDKNGNLGFLDLLIHNYNSGKDIHIKKSKRGTFTKAAKAHGMSVQSFANKVLKNPSKYSAAMRKKANFAHNAASWKH